MCLESPLADIWIIARPTFSRGTSRFCLLMCPQMIWNPAGTEAQALSIECLTLGHAHLSAPDKWDSRKLAFCYAFVIRPFERSRPAANASREPNGAVVASRLRYKCGSLGDSRDPSPQVDAAGPVDEPARPGSCRSRPRCGRRLHRTKPPVDPLEACQSAPGHGAVSHRCTRRSSRSVHPLRASCHHLLQQLPRSALSKVSDGCPRPLDRR